LLIAAPCFPIAYMQAMDGLGYGAGGLSGALVVDATCSLAACGIAALLMSRIQPARSMVRGLSLT
jgi:hypothetical protein